MIVFPFLPFKKEKKKTIGGSTCPLVLGRHHMGCNRKWVFQDDIQAVWRTILRGPRPPSHKWKKHQVKRFKNYTALRSRVPKCDLWSVFFHTLAGRQFNQGRLWANLFFLCCCCVVVGVFPSAGPLPPDLPPAHFFPFSPIFILFFSLGCLPVSFFFSGCLLVSFFLSLGGEHKFKKNHFHQNHFHQQPLSSKTTFIKKPRSSENHVYQKTSFAGRHLHTNTASAHLWGLSRPFC